MVIWDLGSFYYSDFLGFYEVLNVIDFVSFICYGFLEF